MIPGVVTCWWNYQIDTTLIHNCITYKVSYELFWRYNAYISELLKVFKVSKKPNSCLSQIMLEIWNILHGDELSYKEKHDKLDHAPIRPSDVGRTWVRIFWWGFGEELGFDKKKKEIKFRSNIHVNHTSTLAYYT